MTRRIAVIAAVVLVVAAMAGGIGSYYWLRVEVPEPPTLEQGEAIPPVAKAIREARAGVSHSPHSAAAWGWLGAVFLAHKYFPQSAICFQCAERLDPSDPRWPYFYVYWRTPNDPEVVSKLQRSVDLAGDAPDDVRLRLAESLTVQGKQEMAEQQFRQVLRRKALDPRAHLGLARLDFTQGNYSKSVQALRYALDSPYTQKAASHLLAQVHQASGDATEAARDLARLANVPEDKPYPPAYFAREAELLRAEINAAAQAHDLANKGRVAEALAILRPLVANYPDWEQPWEQLGELLIRRDISAAEGALRKATEHVPGSARIRFYLGVALAEQRRHAEAASAFRQALQLNPNYPEAHFGLSRCLIAEGDREGAIQSLIAAVLGLPSYADAQATLGELLAQLERPAEAMVHLRSAIQLRPGDEKSTKLLQELERRRP